MSVARPDSSTASHSTRLVALMIALLDGWADLALGVQRRIGRAKRRLVGHYHRVMGEHDGDADTLVGRTYQQMNTFNRLVVGGITLAIGIIVYNEVISALPEQSDPAVNESNVSGTVEAAFVLAPVALIVIVAGLILANVMGFGSGA